MANIYELEQFIELFEKSKAFLPEDSFLSGDMRIRTKVGINLKGPFEQRGMYRFSEDLGEQSSRYTLVQDTTNGSPVIRGAVIENEAVTKTVGSSCLRGMKMAVDLMIGFISCERYLSIKEE